MSFQKPDWSYQEFMAFLLLYAANADTEVNRDEKELLFSMVSFDDYKRIKRAYEEANDYESLQIILSFKSAYFKDEAAVDKLLGDLKEMFLADNRFDASEKSVFLGLKRLLNQ